MGLAGATIKPAEGKLAVRFVDDEDDEDKGQSQESEYAGVPSEPKPYEGCLAVVFGVGDKVKGIKRGDTVVCSPWARDGLKLPGGLRIINSYEVQATLLA